MLENQLHGVAARHPLVLAAAAGALLATMALAMQAPALRALRLDPARVLRDE